MSTDRTRCVNSLTALVRAHALGIDARHPLTAAQIATIASWRSRNEPLGIATARTEAIRQARRIGDLDHQLKDNRQRLDALVGEHAPELLTLPGVGAVVAAVILTVWSHHGRIKTEAHWPKSLEHARSQHHRATRCVTGSVVAATAASTGRSTPS
ncbi:hypothetical protein AB0L63_32055 [Nocardia sp. NPDC051990]|uniref:hypothetical protein n=1 Tax=Nocardia sp. NPDC051990 TaxID=3155285 RepID=UPI0034312BC1